MAFQELGTNAVKYGALSNQTGRIAIGWSIARQAGETRLELTWKETGGPPVSEPTRRGFGTRLIERSLAHELHGDVTIAFAPRYAFAGSSSQAGIHSSTASRTSRMRRIEFRPRLPSLKAV